ncbi:MAG: outer rane lipoprotein LolB [Betaproteobacteria bacterium]|nr:outer rane lipoprotein LolB [Betaproteobacteria bacterium]
MKFKFQCCAAVCALLLAACASPPRVIDSLPAFELAGRIAVKYQERGFSSSLRWKQTNGRDEIWLTTPLGQTVGFLEAGADGATLTASDQKQYRASSIESLTKSAFGWRFPVDGLRYWVFGEAPPNLPPAAIERDGAKRIARLKQDDWQIAFNYPTADAARPSRLEIVGNDADIRLVIDNLSRGTP